MSHQCNSIKTSAIPAPKLLSLPEDGQIWSFHEISLQYFLVGPTRTWSNTHFCRTEGLRHNLLQTQSTALTWQHPDLPPSAPKFSTPRAGVYLGVLPPTCGSFSCSPYRLCSLGLTHVSRKTTTATAAAQPQKGYFTIKWSCEITILPPEATLPKSLHPSKKETHLLLLRAESQVLGTGGNLSLWVWSPGRGKLQSCSHSWERVKTSPGENTQPRE